ncbi:hypothetical protein CLAFUW4_07641 [Fulvia fulva]|uniref:C2H2-type domain-containing protein n=1 Tax=Passalora fulva TaxID=5499 RepID=A0A9Q8LCL2_PASFU|nr:uncharacterized protein CLAFUR5_07769 [Fulvia fulva]KAK4629225.1 hypothetical protein CLAFUR4_07646 [Fulvia fulva]KAK4630017.1 hypothetical protein CLAFUR0_07646 [Fulvia fulva]UJO14739.1 hypothetical protein CLAFUR5_07769 [Fulvia fulva]WPV12900.1 hypothetical protein CLAFUW4_07641 [Fulvia fulva]WPV27433.1 hypothetical protein CLAFUW7_07642 [Fulvia fulva]
MDAQQSNMWKSSIAAFHIPSTPPDTFMIKLEFPPQHQIRQEDAKCIQPQMLHQSPSTTPEVDQRSPGNPGSPGSEKSPVSSTSTDHWQSFFFDLGSNGECLACGYRYSSVDELAYHQRFEHGLADIII